MAEIRSSQLWEFRPSREMLEKRYEGYLAKLRREPRNAEVLVMAGHTAMGLDRFDDALVHFGAATALNPNLPGLDAAIKRAKEKIGSTARTPSPPPPPAPGFSAEDTSKYYARDARNVPSVLTRLPVPPFAELVPGAFAFAFRGGPILVLLLCTALWYGTGAAMRTITILAFPLYIVVRAYLFAYYMHIIRDTGTHKDQRVTLPDIAHLTGDFFNVVFSIVASFLIAWIGFGMIGKAVYDGHGRARELYFVEDDVTYRRDPGTGRSERIEPADLPHRMRDDAIRLADGAKTGPGRLLVVLGILIGSLYLPIALLACAHFHAAGAAFRFILGWKTVFKAMPLILLPGFIAAVMTFTFLGAVYAAVMIPDRATAAGAETALIAVTICLEIIFARLVGFLELTQIKRLGWA